MDFPEPETPVMHVNVPKGISMFTFFKLLPLAPFSCMLLPFPFLRSFGIYIFILLDKYFAVVESIFKNSLGVPCATIFPPNTPAFGPRSNI